MDYQGVDARTDAVAVEVPTEGWTWTVRESKDASSADLLSAVKCLHKLRSHCGQSSSLLMNTKVNFNIPIAAADCKTMFSVLCQDHGKCLFVEDMSRNDIIVNFMDVWSGCLPLHVCVTSQNLCALQMLMQHPAVDVDARDSRGNTVLHLLAEMEDTKQTQRLSHILLSCENIQVNSTNLSGETAILIAARKARKGLVQSLLHKEGINVDLSESHDRKTARETILSNYPEMKYMLPGKEEGMDSLRETNRLYSALARGDTNTFLKLVAAVETEQMQSGRHSYTLLHSAVYRGCPAAVQALLEKEAQLTVTLYGHTALHVLMTREDSHPHYRQCLDILLDYLDAIDINAVDCYGYSALHIAAANGNEYFLQKLIDNGAKTRSTCHGLTELGLVMLGSSRTGASTDDYRKCFNVLFQSHCKVEINDLQRAAEIGDKYFLQKFATAQDLSLPVLREISRILTVCAKYEDSSEYYWECLHFLVGHFGRNDERRTGEAAHAAMLDAVHSGNHHFLKKLLDIGAQVCLSNTGRTVLHVVVDCCQLEDSSFDDYCQCLDLLLDRLDSKDVINQQDEDGDTALHLAARNGNSYFIKQLMQHGAYAGVANRKGDLALNNIPATTLENYFNSCVTGKEDCIDIDYSVFFPPQSQASTSRVFLLYGIPDCGLLFFLSENPDLRYLLKHPLCNSLLEVKWQLVSLLYYLNLIVYFIFVISITTYIFQYYEPGIYIIFVGDNETMDIYDYDCVSREATSVLVVNILLLLLICMREIVQFVTSPLQYIRSLDNWLELLTLSCGFFLFSTHCTDETTMRHVASLTLLLLWTGLVLHIGRLRRFSCDIEMLMTVTLTLFKTLAVYSGLIIGFSLCFYVLFHQEGGEPNLFLKPGLAIFKTLMMMTGEFDIGDDNFLITEVMNKTSVVKNWKSTYYIGHIVFILFIFTMVIALFNLLVGLAVSDTGAIKHDAELVATISRIKLVSHIDNVMPNYPFCLPKCFFKKWPYFSNLSALKDIIKSITVHVSLSANGRKSILANDSNVSCFADADIYKDAADFLFKSSQSSEIQRLTLYLEKMKDIQSQECQEIRNSVKNALADIKNSCSSEFEAIRNKVDETKIATMKLLEIFRDINREVNSEMDDS